MLMGEAVRTLFLRRIGQVGSKTEAIDLEHIALVDLVKKQIENGRFLFNNCCSYAAKCAEFPLSNRKTIELQESDIKLKNIKPVL